MLRMTAKRNPNVAVIGAGISGVVTAVHLLRREVDVTIFERNSVTGGVWVYDERKPPEPYYPAIIPSKGELSPDRPANGDTPGACYPGLRNNVGTRLMKTSLLEWPEGTPDITTHDVMKDYIQSIASTFDVERHVRFKTTVLNAEERKDGKWRVQSTSGKRDSAVDITGGGVREEIYDYVVVATGHYHAARIPDIPGLKELKNSFPDRVSHSKGWRGPVDFQGKNVLLVGSGASALDIGKDVAAVAGKVFHSHRRGAFDIPLSMFPENVVHVGEVDTVTSSKRTSTASSDHLPVTFNLKDGTSICKIDHLILCTGYHIALPFLPQFHADASSHSYASVQAPADIIVTDGQSYQNLHRDIWFIPSPSLLFIGVPYYTANFSLFDFQAQVAAAVVAGYVELPRKSSLLAEYAERLKEKGAGKGLNSLRGVEVEYVRSLIDWANEGLAKHGKELIKGHTEEWLEAKDEQTERLKSLFSSSGDVKNLGLQDLGIAAACNEVVAAV